MLRVRKTKIGWPVVIGGFVSLAILFHLFYTTSPTPWRTSNWRSNSHKHPVELLHEHAKLRFQSLLERQSSTSAEAATEYRKRYKRDPPPGFDKWVDYALAFGSPIIDDFDIINEGVSAFYDMKPEHVRDLMARTVASQGLDNAVGLCHFVDGEFVEVQGCRSDVMRSFMTALGDAALRIPNVTMLMDFMDEPAVLPVALDDDSDMSWTRRDRQSLDDLTKQACAKLGQRKSHHSGGATPDVYTHGLPFVLDMDLERDMCARPEYTKLHGLFLSPATLRHMPVRVPMLTAGSPHPFTDIVFPSPQYTWKKNRYDPKTDKSWAEKKNAVYWAGSSTGSHSVAGNEASWRSSHRQRLVAMLNGKETHEVTYLDGSRGTYKPYQSTDIDSSLYHVHLTAAIQCDKEACDSMEKAFGPFKHEAWDAPFDYRYLIDIDGNAYANRFYRLLGSDSVPLKTTVFREWHDERLVPWLHYIPISQTFEELPEMVRFLTGTPEGQQISETVAKAGQGWGEKSLNMVQQGVYMYRLMLELAWLQDDARCLT